MNDCSSTPPAVGVAGTRQVPLTGAGDRASQGGLTSAPANASTGADGTAAARTFATKAQLRAAVAQIPTTTDRAWRMQPGPRYRLEVSPGSVRITATDYVRASDAKNEEIARHLRKDADMLLEEVEFARKYRKRGQIKDWSDKSRALMPLRLATLDYATMFEQGDTAALVTLTYPWEWQRLAPDAETFKHQVNLFRTRYRNDWGNRVDALAGIWKMEFQDRGAVHLHIGTTVPQGVQRAPLSADDRQHLRECSKCDDAAHSGLFDFAGWLSRTWSYVVFRDMPEAPAPWSIDGWANERAKHERAGTGVDSDEGKRYSDPKRIGVYFAKHGMFEDKSYQNIVPALWKAQNAGGARFWGYWVVRPLIASKEILETLIMPIVRHLRAVADRSSYSRKVSVVKGGHNPRTGEIWEPRQRKRSVHRRVKRFRNRNGYGYLVVNDGLGVTADIARIIGMHAAGMWPDAQPDFFDSPATQGKTAAGAGWEFGATGHVAGAAVVGGRRHDDGPGAVVLAPVGLGN